MTDIDSIETTLLAVGLLLVVSTGGALGTVSGDPGADAGAHSPSVDDSAVSSVDTAVDAADVSGNAAFRAVEPDQRGDIVNITLEVDDTEYATVTLGSSRAAYLSNVTVEDTDEDGTVTVQFNSYRADGRASNNPSATVERGTYSQYDERNGQWAARSGRVVGTNVTTAIAPGRTHILTAGTYELAVSPGRASDGAIQASPTDVSVMSLETRESPSLRLFRAPEDASLNSQEEIRQAAAAGELTETSDLADGEYLVAAITADGLEGAFTGRVQSGKTHTEAFLSLAEDNVAFLNHSLSTRQLSNTPLTTVLAPSGTTDGSTGTEGVDVIPAPSADTYYVVHDTSEMADSAEFVTGESYVSEFTVVSHARNAANFGLVAPENGAFSDETASTALAVRERNATIETQPSGLIEVAPESGQSITGTSTLAPGTELVARIQSKRGSPSQFIIGPATVEVQEDGTWALSSDFSSYTAGSTFTLRVAHSPGTELATGDGEIIDAGRVESLAFPDQEIVGEAVTVSNVELGGGGFVAIRSARSNQLIGVSESLPRNTQVTDLRIALDQPIQQDTTLTAVPFRDSNGDGEFDAETDQPYRADGTPITESAAVSVRGGGADLTVEDLTVDTDRVVVGDSITVSATVSNDGTATATETVEYRIGGVAVTTQEVTLQPGQRQTVTFLDINTTALGSGTYSHGVYVDDGRSIEEPLRIAEPVSQTSPTAEPTRESTATQTPSAGDEPAGGDAEPERDDATPQDSEPLPLFGGIAALAVGATAVGAIAYRRLGTTAELESLEEWPYPGRGPTNTAAAPECQSVRPDATTRWTSGTTGASQPTLTDEVVYSGLANGTLVACDATSGRAQWEATVGEEPTTVPAVEFGSLYVASGRRVAAFSRQTGTRLWTETVDSPVAGAVTPVDDTLYVACQSGTVLAANAKSGATQWEHSLSDVVDHRPTVTDDHVLVTTRSGVVALSAATGDEVWRFELGETPTTAPAAVDGSIYVATESGTVCALQATDGSQHWAVDTGVLGPERVVTGSETVWVAGGQGTVVALDTDGVERWSTIVDESAMTGSAVVEDTLYLCGRTTVYGIDATGGGQRWRVSVSDRITGVTPTSDALYLGTDGGLVGLAREGQATGWGSSTDTGNSTARTSQTAGDTSATTRQRNRPEIECAVASLHDLAQTEDGAVTTYRGQHEDSDEPVRVHTLDHDDESVQAAFSQTVSGWYNAHTHPNVVSVHARGDDPQPWIAVSAPADAVSLDERMADLSTEDIVALLTDAAEGIRNVGLYNAHHFDLSPECLWVEDTSETPAATVGEWGLDRCVREATDAVKLTPYTAPEQFDDTYGRPGTETDVYGLGAVAYHALAGEPPVTADRTAIAAGEIEPLATNADVPADLSAVIERALETDPADRYTSMYDFATDLENVL